jgi:hypothetical protein
MAGTAAVTLSTIGTRRKTALGAALEAHALNDADEGWFAELQRLLAAILDCADTQELIVQYLLGEPRQLVVLSELRHIDRTAQLSVNNPDWWDWGATGDELDERFNANCVRATCQASVQAAQFVVQQKASKQTGWQHEGWHQCWWTVRDAYARVLSASTRVLVTPVRGI